MSSTTTHSASDPSGTSLPVSSGTPGTPGPLPAGTEPGAAIAPGRRGRRARSKRGTIMLLALGVLGILSVSAIAYVTIVRLDRDSSIVTVRQGNYQQQADVVVNEIGAVIAADLFGNKVVTTSVPVEADPGTSSIVERIWPSMFEDGEFVDVPTTAVLTFNDGSDDDHELEPRERAYADDAWLASTEPEWESTISQTKIWPQITNLRSTYRYVDDDPTTRSDDMWERGDGRFVDLAQWFIQRRAGYADPSVDLLDDSYAGSEDFEAPREGNAFTSTPSLDDKTKVFDKQMNGLEMSNTDNLRGRIAPSDERRWVDTDGDLRADARWTLLDGLGNVGGLNWVVAARIVDLSALVNYNASLESGAVSSGALTTLGNGRTPADVDLLRILRLASAPESLTAFDPDPRTDRLDQTSLSAFNEHLRLGLALRGVFEELYERDPGDDLTQFNLEFNDNQWSQTNPTTRLQREQFWLNVGQSPTNPSALTASFYPVRDLTDLMSFWGTNNSTLVSRAEQFFDGPQAEGYLPIPNDPDPNLHGPLRSKENGGLIRELIQDGGSVGTDDSPTAEQLKASVRRLITPISGVGTMGPVPVLNDNRDYINSLDSSRAYGVPRVPVSGPLSEQAIRDSFASLVWALAPFATDQPLAQAFIESGLPALTADVHYGGTTTGPADRFYGTDSFTSASPGFAIITAASMAANIADAVDNEQDNPTNDSVDGVDLTGGRNDSDPTVIRIINDPEFPAPSAQNPPAQPVLGTRLPQGDIPFDALPMANPTIDAIPQAITVVGVERQPYFREVLLGMFLSDAEETLGNKNAIVGDLSSELIGAFVLVELSNPWDSNVALGDYSIVIPETRNQIYLDNNPNYVAGTGPLRLEFTEGTEMTPGSTRQFLWITPATGTGISAQWVDVYNALTTVDTSATDPFNLPVSVSDISPTLIVEQLQQLYNLARNEEQRPVLLTKRVSSQKAPVSGSQPEADLCIAQDEAGTGLEVASFLREAVVDRLSPRDLSSTSTFPPPISSIPGAMGGFSLVSVNETTTNSGLLNAGGPMGQTYFEEAGYPISSPEPGDTRWANSAVSGQMLISASLSRPGTQPVVGAGFPAWVMEFGPEYDVDTDGNVIDGPVVAGKNRMFVRRDVQAWLTPPMGFDPAVPASWADRAGSRFGDASLLIADDTNTVYNIDFPEDHDDELGVQGKQADGAISDTEVPSFQVFVPDAPLHNVSELLMVSAFANVYLGPREADRLAAGGEFDTDNNGQNDLFADCECSNATSPARPRSEWIANDLRRWRTASEQMALNIRYNHSAGGGTAPNPYVGVLDPSRFILSPTGGSVTGDLDQVGNLPDTMALPLALRVPDCFEALDVRDADGLVQGRININTAPVEVLRALPLLDPENTITAGASTLNDGDGRVEAIDTYRQPDGVNGTEGIRNTTAVVNPLNVRGRAPVADLPPQTGFATPAELAVLGNWDANGVPTLAQTETMLVLGADGAAADAEPLQAIERLPFNRGYATFNGASTNPIDDPEERMALYRAVSNIATARSDVFAAWFVIRGYDPEIIERIPVSASGNIEDEALDAMDLPENNFAPTHESRYFVVFDRSNVRRPTDRPRVLLQVELPASAN